MYGNISLFDVHVDPIEKCALKYDKSIQLFEYLIELLDRFHYLPNLLVSFF